jgi:hypothetical protein
MVRRQSGILSRVARSMRQLGVLANSFSFFAVWKDVIDHAIFEGKDLIRAKCTERIFIVKLLTEFESEKSRFNRCIIEQQLNYRFKRRPT